MAVFTVSGKTTGWFEDLVCDITGTERVVFNWCKLHYTSQTLTLNFKNCLGAVVSHPVLVGTIAPSAHPTPKNAL